MPGKGPGDVQNESPVRLFNTRALLSHNAHSKSRPGRREHGCGFCKSGVDGISQELERKEPEPELVESDRDDKEGRPASPPDRWWDRTEE